MKLQISGKQIDIGDALRTHITDALGKIVEKYFDDPLDAHVTMIKRKNVVEADIAVHVSRGMIVRGHHVSDLPYPAFDQALHRLEERLRRYKTRIRDHHKNQASHEFELAYQYILEHPENDGKEASEGHPAIIAEINQSIPRLSVSEAVMHLDLDGSSSFLFYNTQHGGLNVVHKRTDGNIGWIDPKVNAEMRKLRA